MKHTFTKSIVLISVVACLLVACLVLAGCNRVLKPLDNVSASTITYDGEQFRWDAVKYAEFYQLDVNGTPYTTKTPSLDLALDTDVTVKITAMPEEGSRRYTASEEAATAQFTAVGPTVVEYKNDRFEWAAIEGVERYAFEQNNVRYQGYTDKTFMDTVRAVDSDRATLRVKPITTADHSFGVWSASKSVIVLPEPTNITYNETVNSHGVLMERIIDWDDVPGATEYKVELGDNVYYTPASQFVFDSQQTISWDTYVNQTVGNSFFVKLTAVGDPNTEVVSSGAVEKSFLCLGTATNLAIKEGVLSWDSVQGASSYQVKVEVDGETTIETVYTNRFDGLVAGKLYTLSVKAGTSDKGTFSSWSIPVSKTLLAAPKLSWTQNGEDEGVTQGNITMEKAPNSKGHDWYIYKGETRREGVLPYAYQMASDNPTLSFAPDEAGVYYVYAVANATGEYASSHYSEPLRIIVLRTLDSIAFESYEVVGNDKYNGFSSTSRVDVAFNPPDYCDDVKVKLGDYDYNGVISKETVEKPDGTTYAYQFTFDRNINPDVTGTAQSSLTTLSIQAVNKKAGVFDEETNTVILNAQWKKVILYQAGTPSNVKFDAGVLSWDAAPQANGYYYVLESVPYVEGSEGKEGYSRKGFVYGTAVTFPEDVKPGLYSFKVAARGNGNMMITGTYSGSTYLYKLATPKNLTVSADGVLTWDAVTVPETDLQAITTNYMVYVGGTRHVESSNILTINTIDVSITGSPVYVTAIGKNVSIADGEVYVVSSNQSNQEGEGKTVMLYKLPTPDTPAISDTFIHWNAVDNANCYELKYGTETVKTIQEKAIDCTLDEALLRNMATLCGGNALDLFLRAYPDNNYNLCSQAKSEGNEHVYYFASDYSVGHTVTVMSTPEPEIDDTTGKLTWEALLTADCYAVRVTNTTTQRVDTYTLPVEHPEDSTEKVYLSFIPTVIGKAGDTLSVEIYAVGNGVTSISSVPWRDTNAIKLAKQKTPGAYTVTAVGNNITVKLAEGDPKVTYYGVNVGGVEHQVIKTDMLKGYTFNAANSGQYDIKVRALGNNRTIEDGQLTVWLPSEYTLTTTVYMLRALSHDTMRLLPAADGKHELQIDHVYMAARYDYTLEYCYVDSNDEAHTIRTENGSATVTNGVVAPIEVEWGVKDAEEHKATLLRVTIVVRGDNVNSFDSQESILYFNIA